jgi:hypothetical protein
MLGSVAEGSMSARRDLLLAMIFSTAAAIPVAAQPVGSAAIPDFSGIWAHPWLPGFESLASGPTSLVNLSRRPDGVSNVLVLAGDYNNPILKPAARETVKQFGEMSKAHYGFHNPRNQCWPNGLPFVLSSNGMQIFDRGDHLTIIYQTDHQMRRVRMNQPHPANVTPSWYGDSVGHYEGDTLVIDTVGIKTGPFAMIDWFGTPQSPALHVVERYRLIDYDQAKDGLARAFKDNSLPNPPTVDLNYRGKYLQLLFTVDDPNVFTTPWSATVTYGRPAAPISRGLNVWLENVCAENPRKYGTEDDAQVPTAANADF